MVCLSTAYMIWMGKIRPIGLGGSYKIKVRFALYFARVQEDESSIILPTWGHPCKLQA